VITQEDAEKIKRAVSYDPDTGLFTFRERPRKDFQSDAGWKTFNKLYAGKPALTTLTGGGYLTGRINMKTLKAHRVAFLVMEGRWPSEIDHINRIKTDNRWCNLREATRIENCQNRNKRTDGASGITGVYFHRKMQKWQASIGFEGRSKHLGTFDCKEDALAARREAEAIYHGT
jgi:hypothetical protein